MKISGGIIMSSLTGEDKKALTNRLKRIEGQVRGINRMIEEDKYCIDILTQIAATRGALKNVGLKVLNRHVEGCVSNAMQEGDNNEIIEELVNTVDRFVD